MRLGIVANDKGIHCVYDGSHGYDVVWNACCETRVRAYRSEAHGDDTTLVACKSRIGCRCKFDDLCVDDAKAETARNDFRLFPK